MTLEWRAATHRLAAHVAGSGGCPDLERQMAATGVEIAVMDVLELQ
jgi:hypothetical protein